jgi:hypothetical protein
LNKKFFSLQENIYTEADMIKWLQGNITGMPEILNLTQPELTESQYYNSFTNPLTINLTSGLTWICISNITLEFEGFVYVAIAPVDNKNLSLSLFNMSKLNTTNQTQLDNELIWNSTNLTYYQIRKGIDHGDKIVANSSQWQNYNKSKPLSFNFTYLQNTTFYKIYLYTTSDNPSYTAWKSPLEIRAFPTVSIDKLKINRSPIMELGSATILILAIYFFIIL